MIPALPHPVPVICRMLLWLAARLVPLERREDWLREWRGELWHWMSQRAEEHGDTQASAVLRSHCWGALQDAALLRWADWNLPPRLREWAVRPEFVFVASGGAVLLLAAVSFGFQHTRRILLPQSYSLDDRLILVSQQFPFMGMRTGLRSRDLDRFTEKSQDIATFASYVWYDAAFDGSVIVRAAKVTPDFFAVLGVSPAMGAGLSAECPDCFVASDSFYRRHLNADPSALNRTFQVEGRAMRLSGVLPPGFAFLSESPGIWTSFPGTASFRALTPSRRGAIARLHDGVSLGQAQAHLGLLNVPYPKTMDLDIVPLRSLSTRVRRVYGSVFLGALFLAWVWALLAYVREQRRSLRYWSIFGAKLTALVVLLAVVVFELTGVHRMGLAGDQRMANEFAAAWITLFGAGFAFWWSWTDHRKRCRVCLYRMTLPVRIGEPGRLLFDFDGRELLCPNGHGTLYTPESALETHEPESWYSLGETGDVVETEKSEP